MKTRAFSSSPCALPSPPPLRRVSALVSVRFTPRGRRMARKLCFQDEGGVYWYYASGQGEDTEHVFVRPRERRVLTDAKVLPEMRGV
jgi:hypothetical protein